MSSLHDQRAELAGVPVRLVHAGDPAGCRGTVLFHHGLSARIADQTKELHSLAAAGFLAVGVDAVGHGVRRDPAVDARLEGPGFREEFRRLVEATTAETPGLVDELLRRGWAREGALGLGGISMGGFVAYRAAVLEPRLTAVTPILGSPTWNPPAPGAPAETPEAFWPVALLSQTGGADESVPPGPARDFHEVLRPRYAAAPERLAYREFAGCPHFFPEARWEELWAGVVAWYGRWLGRA